jgi:hypothetical protein
MTQDSLDGTQRDPVAIHDGRAGVPDRVKRAVNENVVPKNENDPD